MPRQWYSTPRTRLHWSSLAEWLDAASQLERRRHTYLNNERKRLHVASLPLSLIVDCDEPELLVVCRNLLQHGPTHFRRPLRGQRADAPHTRLLVEINNQLLKFQGWLGP
jgi:hypothetical protein